MRHSAFLGVPEIFCAGRGICSHTTRPEKLRYGSSNTCLVPVREVEKQTGLHFFSTLSAEEQERIESTKAPVLWQ
jgi:DNA/RNA endonuclease G (NUC1)